MPLQVVFELTLRPYAAANLENVRRNNLGIESNEIPRTVPQISGAAEQIMKLVGMRLVQTELRERQFHEPSMSMPRIKVNDHQNCVLAVLGRLAETNQLRVVHVVEMQILSGL